MSGRRSGLGRGLESLIPGIGSEADRGAAITVDVDALEPNPLQPRVRWDEEQLESLAGSIAEYGIIQPIVVSRPGTTKPYQIIAGERRWRAAQRAGLAAVPILVREATPAQILELALVENIQRSDLNPIEEALAYRQLTVEFGLKQSEVAARVGRSRPSIANTLRLLSASEPIREAVVNEEITAGHAKALLAIADAGIQDELLNQVIRNDLSVRETERLVQRVLDSPVRPATSRTRHPDPTIERIARDLQQALGTKVDIKRSGQKGRIVIDFFSDDELNAILGRIVGVEDDF
mgnify:FL=1